MRHNERLYNYTLYTARQCLLPLRYTQCFLGCLFPSLCGECIDCGLGLGTHRFGFGTVRVSNFF